MRNRPLRTKAMEAMRKIADWARKRCATPVDVEWTSKTLVTLTVVPLFANKLVIICSQRSCQLG